MPLGSDLVSSQPPALRRSGRARTTRYRDDFIDTTLLQYVAPPDEPHAFAEEDEPQQSKKSPAPKALSPKPTPCISYQDPDDRPVGPDHQAGIPALRPRPAQPTPTESKFLQVQPLYAPAQLGAAGSADRAATAAAFKAQYQAAPDAAAKRALLDAAVQQLDTQMGPEMVQVLHLGQLGSKLRAAWQPHEELLFCLGMCDKYRFFKYIRQCYLWQRSAHELNGYYHNVWKKRSTPEADEFLTLWEQGASKEVMWQFVDKIRDRLTSMWDRKKMGDMPKLLKDAAAAAAADAELQAAADIEGAYSEGAPASPSASLDTVTDDSIGAAAVVVVSKPRQRKRPAAAAAVSSKQKAQFQALPVKQEQEDEAMPGQQQQQQPSAPAAQQAVAAVDEHGTQQQQPKRQRRQQQQQRASPASTAAVQAVAVMAAPSIDAQAVMQYPEMPTYPEPDITDAAALEEWMKHIPAYRALMTEYMKTVNCMTDAAVEGYQRRIHEAQQHRERLQAQADAYIRSLVAQGQQVLRQVEARAASHHHQQQLQAAPVTPAQPLPQPVQQLALQQQQHQPQDVQQQQQQQQQQLQQQQQAVPVQQDATGDLQSAVQQLLVTHTKRTKQQLQAKLTGVPAPAQPPAQPAQVQRQVSAEPLPFPMGPASKWLSLGSTGGAAVGAPVEVRCGRSSSEDCEVFLACNEGTLC